MILHEKPVKIEIFFLQADGVTDRKKQEILFTNAGFQR